MGAVFVCCDSSAGHGGMDGKPCGVALEDEDKGFNFPDIYGDCHRGADYVALVLRHYKAAFAVKLKEHQKYCGKEHVLPQYF